MDKHQGLENEEAVRVVANVQIQNRDSICSNTTDEPSAEFYVGQVTHLRSIKVIIKQQYLPDSTKKIKMYTFKSKLEICNIGIWFLETKFYKSING